jgi:hypothetical protein
MKGGRLPKAGVNIFAGLLFDARDGGRLHQVNKGKKDSGKHLVSYRAAQGLAGSKYVSFPFTVFEEAVKSYFREIDPRDLLPPQPGDVNEAVTLAGRRAEVEAEIDKLKARLQTRFTDAVADVLERREDELKALSEQMEARRQEEASPLGEAWGECKTLIDAERAASDKEEFRVRLRAAIRRIVEGIWCLFVARGSRRVAAVEIHFTGGKRRIYLIIYRRGAGGSVKARPSRWCMLATPSAVWKPEQQTLRDRDDAGEFEEALLDMPLEAIEKVVKLAYEMARKGEEGVWFGP